MAQIERLDFAGLQYYDQKIKNHIESEFTAHKPDLSGYFNGVDYKKAEKKVYFKNGESNVASLDVTDFMLDKAVDDVEITNGSGDNTGKQVLKITWNTDAGSKTVEIPLEKIFNPSNYYTKSEVDTEFGKYYTKTEVDDEFAKYTPTTDFVAISTAKIDTLFPQVD